MSRFPSATLKEVLGEKGYIRGPFGSALKRNELLEAGIPVYEQQHAIRHSREFRFFVNEDKCEELSRFMVLPGDLIISCSGTVGEISLIKESDPPGIISQALLILRPSKEKLLPDFLRYYLLTREGRHSITAASHGSVQINIAPRSVVESIKVPVPSLREQQIIAHILGTLDNKIELNRKTNETLEGIAKALFKTWFVDFDPVRAKAEGRPTGLPDEISELFPDSLEESELGEIPSGWSQSSIGKEANLLTGFPFKSALFANSPPGVRLARGMNVKEGFLFWESQSRFWRGGTEEYKKYFLDVGDILIGMDGSKVGKNWVRVRASDLPCLLVQRVARLRHESSIGETFLRFLVGSDEFTAYVDLVKTGTSIPHISLKQIKEYAFTRPEKSDNRLFAAYEEICLPMMRKIDNNYAQSIVLSSLRDYLLPRLISGELRVPDAEKMVEEVGI